jgi:hypothetical protein
MTQLKKVGGAVKGGKFVFVRLSKAEIGDIVTGLNLYLDNEAGLSRDADSRVLRLRNRLRKMKGLEQEG